MTEQRALTSKKQPGAVPFEDKLSYNTQTQPLPSPRESEFRSLLDFVQTKNCELSKKKNEIRKEKERTHI
jgi:hypothetical protein